jgi:hypothetical protein
LYTTGLIDDAPFLISGKNAISNQKLHYIWDLIKVITNQQEPMDPSMGPRRTLSQDAWKVIAERERNFKMQQSFVRKMIDLMLSKYNSSDNAVCLFDITCTYFFF